MTADVQREPCNYGHTKADHERVGACERPPLSGPGFSLLVAGVVGEALARHAVACQGCGALVLRNLNAIEQHRRHDGLIANAEKQAAAAAPLLNLVAHDLRLHADEWPLAGQFARRIEAIAAPEAH